MVKKTSTKEKISKKNKEYLEELFSKKTGLQNKGLGGKKSSKSKVVSYTKKLSSKGVRKKRSFFPKPKEEENMPVQKNVLKPEQVVLEVPKKQVVSSRLIHKIIFILVVLFILVMFLVVVLLFYDFFKNSGDILQTNENVNKAFVNDGVLHVELKDVEGVNSVRLIFLGDREYYFQPAQVKTNYEFVPGDLGLNTFDGFQKVSAVFD